MKVIIIIIITDGQVMRNGSRKNAEEFLRVWGWGGEWACFSSLTGCGF